MQGSVVSPHPHRGQSGIKLPTLELKADLPQQQLLLCERQNIPGNDAPITHYISHSCKIHTLKFKETNIVPHHPSF